jgi:hypothetical protein
VAIAMNAASRQPGDIFLEHRSGNSSGLPHIAQLNSTPIENRAISTHNRATDVDIINGLKMDPSPIHFCSIIV